MVSIVDDDNEFLIIFLITLVIKFIFLKEKFIQ